MKTQTPSIDSFLLRLIKSGKLNLLTEIRPGRESQIHASPNSSVFVKNIDDTYLEIRYSVAGSHYPDEKTTLSLSPLAAVSTPILARRGGSATSQAKATAARANGLKGGRPRKKN